MKYTFKALCWGNLVNVEETRMRLASHQSIESKKTIVLDVTQVKGGYSQVGSSCMLDHHSTL